MNLRHKLDLDRWYKLKDHPVQTALVNDDVRFKVVPAGRRSGKTERAKRFVVRAAMQRMGAYFVAAPTRDQVKKIYWQDLKRLSLCSMLPKKPSESDLIIYFPNGSTITCIGLDVPQRIEGVFWSGGIIDEIADVKSDAWEANISPALDTYNPSDPDYRAWCWLIGVPDGLNHYYDMYEYAKSGKDKDWRAYEWKSSDILPKDTVDSARARMSPEQFAQEYEAQFANASGRAYPHFDRNLNGCTINWQDRLGHEMFYIGMDFNVHNCTATVCIVRDGNLYAVDEFTGQLDTPTMCNDIKKRYGDNIVDHAMIFPDASGRAQHSSQAGISDLSAIKSAGFKMYVETTNPKIIDRVNHVNAIIMSATHQRRFFVNVAACPQLTKSLERQALGDDKKPIKINNLDHSPETLGYVAMRTHPIFEISDGQFVQQNGILLRA